MEANVIFNNAKVYDVTKFDVLLGQNFSVELIGFNGTNAGWFSNFDSVLTYDITPDGNLGVFIASQIGKSTINIFDSNNAKVKSLEIEVYSTIATSLKVEISTPEFK